MTLENGGAGVVPVMDMNRGYGDGMGFGGGWWAWIFIIFAMMGGWGGNWNNRGNMGAEIFANGSMTRDQIADQFSMQDIKDGIRGVQNGLCDGFYAQNSTMLNGFNGVQRDIMQNGYQLGSEIAQNRFAAQQCCCEQKQAIATLGYETNRNIDAVRYENARNTCEIVNAVKEDGEKTRAVMVANTIQELRDKLADRDRDLQTANFQLSQQAQNANLIGTLRPYPQPAYLTNSPYQSIAANVAGACGCAYQQQIA